jgi:hypothetical protein
MCFISSYLTNRPTGRVLQWFTSNKTDNFIADCLTSLFSLFSFIKVIWAFTTANSSVGDHPRYLCLNVDYPLGDRQGLSNILAAVAEHRGHGR